MNKKIIIPYLIASLMLTLSSTFAQYENIAQGYEKVFSIFEPLGNQQLFSQQDHQGVLASYSVRVQRDMIKKLEVGNNVLLQYTAADRWEGKIQRVERRSEDSYSIFGNIIGSQEGWFIFTIDEGGMMAAIQIPTMNIIADLRNLQDDSYKLSMFDSRKVGHFDCGVRESPEKQIKFDESVTAPNSIMLTNVPQHDIIVVYTKGLANDFPNHFPNTPLNTAIQHLIDYSNQAYSNSGVQLRLRLVYRGLVDPNFSEAGHSRDTLLSRLTGTNDGYIDNIHTLRTTYRADLVCLLYSYDTQGTGGGGGLAWLLNASTYNTGNPSNWYSSGFCVVEALWEPNNWEPPLSGMVLTEFTHEVGHNQGLAHNCESDPGTPVRSYAHGWRFVGNSSNKYVTIMSYLTGSYANASIIPNFSNPSVFFDGQPTGNATTAGCGGTTGAKNADALTLTADFMSKLHLKPLDPWVDLNYTGGTQNGRFETPWKTLGSAIGDLPVTNNANTPTPPTVTVKGPASTGNLATTFNKRMRLNAQGGVVRIGGQ